MPYQIHYPQSGQPRMTVVKKTPNRPLRILGLLLALVLGIRLLIPDAGQRLREFLLPGVTEETSAAFRLMVEDIRDGASFGDAVTAFCREVIADAAFSRN